MRAVIAALLAFFSTLAGAQTQINVMYFFTPPAISYVQNTLGQSLSTFGASLTTNVNGFLIGSGVSARVNTVGTFNGSACCTGLDGLYGVTTPGVMTWARQSIPLNVMRDTTGADIVVVVGDYDNNDGHDISGMSLGKCSSGTRDPEHAYVGINVRWQLIFSQNQSLLAHEIGHQLCMTDAEGWYRQTGSTPADCEARWTMEYGDGSTSVANFPAYTSACWKVAGTGPTCYGSGHAAIASFKNGAGPCTFSGGTLNATGDTWTEFMQCGSGAANYLASRTTVQNPAFTCTNAMQVPYYAGSGAPPGYSGGTLVRNSVAAMNAQAPLTAQFRNKKLSPPLIAAVMDGL